MDFEMSIKVTRNNIERGRGGVESKQAFDFFAAGCFNAKVQFSGGVSTILQMLVSLLYLYIALVADKF